MLATNVINLSIPSIRSNPSKWFDSYDADRDEILSSYDMITGLKETLGAESLADKKVIGEVVESIWGEYDDDCSGSIEKLDFLKGGMAKTLIRMEQEWNMSSNNRSTSYLLHALRKKPRRHTYLPPPKFSEDPCAWFEHFDIDKSGTLSQREAIHGVYTTLNAVTSKQRADIRKHVLSWDWGAFDEIGINKFVKSGIADNLRDFIEECLSTATENPLSKENANNVKIKVFVPDNSIPGDLITVCSPKSKEMVLVMIPDKALWGGGNGEKPFFYAQF